MDTKLFEQFAPAIRAGALPDDARLRLATEADSKSSMRRSRR